MEAIACKRDTKIEKPQNVLRRRFSSLTFENLIDLTVVMWFCSTPIKSVVFRILDIVGLGSFTQLVVGCLTFVPLVVYAVARRRLPCKHFLILYAINLIWFTGTYLVHPEYAPWYTRENFGVAYAVFRPDHGALWAVLMVELCGTTKRLWQNLKIVALVLFAYDILLAINAYSLGYWTYINQDGIVAKRTYDLDFGYEMMFISMICLICAIKERRHWFLAPGILSILLAFQFGSRGAFLCLIVFAVLWAFFCDVPRPVKIGIVATITILVLIVIFYGAPIAAAVGNYLQSTFHVDSRTIEQMASGNLFDDNGRNRIYSLVISALQSNPFGYGAFGDRPVVGPEFAWGYSHNLFLELAMNFGVVLAFFMLVALAVLLIRQFLFSRNEYTVFVLMLTTSMCARLLVSDTFWGNNYFWITIAVLWLNHRKIVTRSILKREKDGAKFVHIMGAGGTNTKQFYEFLSTFFPKSNHDFIGRSASSESFSGIKDGCRVIPTASLSTIIALNKVDCIVAHNLINPKVLLILACQPWLHRKVAWVIWGGDIYARESQHWTMGLRIAEMMRHFLYSRIRFVVFCSEGDLAYAKQHYHIRPTLAFNAVYPTPINNGAIAEELAKMPADSTGPIVIQVGNSATETNQHEGALDALAHLRDEDIRIFLPLNYGEANYREYAAQVIDYARGIFGDKVEPLLEHIDGDSYLRMLRRVKVGLFNNNRQQAMGNISQLALLGGKIYLRRDTSMWEHFKSLGCTFNDIEEVGNLSLTDLIKQDPDAKKRNERILAARQDINKKKEQWSDLFVSIGRIVLLEDRQDGESR